MLWVNGLLIAAGIVSNAITRMTPTTLIKITTLKATKHKSRKYIAFAVTEPTPSALYDLKRVLYLANHFRIGHGIVINKFDLEKKFCSQIEDFAKENDIPIIGKIPYRKDFVDSTIKIKPVVEINPKYKKIFKKIINKINKN